MVSLIDLPADTYCVSLNQQILHCAQASDFPLQLSIQFNQNSQLHLLNQHHQVVLNWPLQIKSQLDQSGRRRLRSPWSLF